MRDKLAPLLLALAGVIFLVPSVKHLVKGEPLTWSLSLATAIGFFLCVVVSLGCTQKAVPVHLRCDGRVTAKLSRLRVACSIAMTALECSCSMSCVARGVSAEVDLLSGIEATGVLNDD
jgi:hypothetical protein